MVFFYITSNKINFLFIYLSIYQQCIEGEIVAFEYGAGGNYSELPTKIGREIPR